MSIDTHAHHHDDHEHHAKLPDEENEVSDHELLEIAVRELLIEKGVLSGDDVRSAVESMDMRSPAMGARVAARAWTDPAFKALLLANGNAAIRRFGVETGVVELMVVENKPRLHNMVVCTLCSCYPRLLLGIPPAWYKSRPYRSRAVREPRAVLAEFGTVLPDDVEVRVHDSTADLRYMVLPERPARTEGFSETELTALVSRDSLIGVAKARDPA